MVHQAPFRAIAEAHDYWVILCGYGKAAGESKVPQSRVRSG
jgi:hypothetical protein